MLKKIILPVLAFCAIICKAQYPAALIPDSLKKDAKMVIRLEEEIYEIKSPAKAIEKEKRVYSIMNEDGKNYADYNSYYDKFTSINYIDGRLYNAEGKEIKHVKKKDMTDESGSDDETLMTDTRYKRYNMEYGTYPYTASYEEEDDVDGIFHLPYWYPQPRPGISVEVSRLVVIAPKDYVLRYKQTNFNAGPVITEQGDKKVYTWEIKNLPARQSEDYAPIWQELTPYVILEPSLFEVSGYKGDMSTWESFGKFINTLNQGKDVLPDAVKQTVHQLTDKITDQKEKIKVLYSYMQQNTRYINVDFGIGGWQPFDATYVYTKRYGDCKALSNYMVSLLKEAGIKANYVLIRAGKDATPMMTDFPNPIFSHATVCIPSAKDTMWLECTSQTSPAGYIGDFTGNRKALLIDENGGHVVDTKRYTSKENKDVTTVTGEIDETGKLTATLNTSYYGYNYFSAHVRANYYSKEDQSKHLKNVINLATYDVKSFKYEDIKSDDPLVKEMVEVTADGAATITGKRLFFTPNFLTQSGGKLEPSDNRKFDVVYNNDNTNIDSITFKMPTGYVVEAMAKDVSINNKFGKYEIHFKVDGDKLTVTRYQESNSGRYPPSEYNNFVKFYNDIYKADRSKIVFVKKE